MNGKALVPIVLVVLVILTLAPGPILAAESKKQDAPGDFEQRFAEGVRLHDAGTQRSRSTGTFSRTTPRIRGSSTKWPFRACPVASRRMRSIMARGA